MSGDEKIENLPVLNGDLSRESLALVPTLISQIIAEHCGSAHNIPCAITFEDVKYSPGSGEVHIGRMRFGLNITLGKR